MRCLVFTYERGVSSLWRVQDIPEWFDPLSRPVEIREIYAVVLKRRPCDKRWHADDVFHCNMDVAVESTIIRRFADYVRANADVEPLFVPTDEGDCAFLEERARACKLAPRAFEAIELLKSRQRPLQLTYNQAITEIRTDNELEQLIALDIIDDLASQEWSSPANTLGQGLRFLVQGSYGWVLSESLRSLLAAFGCSLSETQGERMERLTRMLKKTTKRANDLQATLDWRERKMREVPYQAPF